jgi:hypothetical protein
MENEAALHASLGEIHSEIALQSTPEFTQTWLNYSRASITLRQRYAEDEWGETLGVALSSRCPCSVPSERVPERRALVISVERRIRFGDGRRRYE